MAPIGTRPFVDRPARDTAAATRLATTVAADLGRPAPLLVNVGMNVVFATGDAVIRVSRPTAPAAEAYALADGLAAAGIRVAAPFAGRIVATADAGADDDDDDKVVPLVATVWERLRAVGQVDWVGVGAMVGALHRLDAAAAPAGYPRPPCTTLPWWDFDRLLEQTVAVIDRPAHRGLAEAVERHRGWIERSGAPASWVLCHGDVHPLNVIATADGPAIIDWDLLSVGPPAWDHGPLRSMIRYWGYPPSLYSDFGRGYGADWSDDPVANALTELRAVAATLLTVAAGRLDPTARAEADARLRHWRGEPDAPTWWHAGRARSSGRRRTPGTGVTGSRSGPDGQICPQ